MKIDTSKIPGFETLPDETKAALVAMEFADAPDMSQFVAKSVFDRKASEAADLNKQLKARMGEDELKAAQAAEEKAAADAALKEALERVKALETEKTIGTYTSSYLAMGYDEKTAKSSAEALAKGDMETVFKNQKSVAEAKEKALRAELLKQTPSPAAGNDGGGMTKKDFSKLTLDEKQAFAKENPDEYKAMYAE